MVKQSLKHLLWGKRLGCFSDLIVVTNQKSELFLGFEAIGHPSGCPSSMGKWDLCSSVNLTQGKAKYGMVSPSALSGEPNPSGKILRISGG